MTSTENAECRQTTLGLILWPALVSLAVTLLRLAGELLKWSPRWFSTNTMGIEPSGVSWLIGITWLGFPFGIYFACRLIRGGKGPRSIRKAVLLAICGLLIMLTLETPALGLLRVGFPQILIFVWLTMVLAAALQYVGWPELFRTLLLYGLAARIPVAIIMFLAMAGNWGTHYDYVGTPFRSSMSFVAGYLWLAFFPQLVFWVAFTVVLGFLGGAVAVLLTGRKLPDRVDVI
jgi:hypothetical protein